MTMEKDYNIYLWEEMFVKMSYTNFEVTFLNLKLKLWLYIHWKNRVLHDGSCVIQLSKLEE